MKNLVLILAIIFTIDSWAQTTLNGVTLPGKVKGTKGDLVLSGAGVRKKSMFKVYVLGLYLKEKSKDAPAIIKADEEMLVRLQITSSVVNEKNMTEAIMEGFEKSMNGNIAPLKTKIDASLNAFKGTISVGDVFEFHYIPGTGVKSYKNGDFILTTEGLEFKKALFGIWLGTNPVDAGLKQSVIGG